MSAEVIRVIRTTSVIGRGTDNDYCREITQFWMEDGTHLATVDPWLDPRNVQRSREYGTLTAEVAAYERLTEGLKEGIQKACDAGARLGNAMGDIRKVLTDKGNDRTRVRLALVLIDNLPATDL